MNPINTRLYSISIIVLASIFFGYPWTGRADFEPLPLTPDSYNHDVVVENSAPPAIVPVTTASMEQGTDNLGLTWFERGFLREYPTTGLPQAGSVFTSDQSAAHSYRMPYSYETNNAVLIDTVRTNATLVFTAPTNYHALSFLTSSGGARMVIRYTVRHGENGAQSGTFVSPNWYNDGQPAVAGNGSVNVVTFVHADLYSYNPRLYSIDVSLSNLVAPVTSVELSLESGSGHAAVFAISGARNPGGFVPIALRGYTADLVVEAAAIEPGFLTTNTTATMDNGTANTRFTWYEKGYYPLAPSTGLPEPGSLLISEADSSHHFQLPGSYHERNAALTDASVRKTVLTLATPVSCCALSFLTASGHGPVTNKCVVTHLDGFSETNSLVSPDWLTGPAPAFTAQGRVSVSTRLTDRISTDGPRLYAVDVVLAHTNSPVSTISLSFMGGGVDAHAVVFSVSGMRAGSITTRPTLQIARNSAGQLVIRSSHSGRLQSCGALPATTASWRDEALVSDSLTITPVPQPAARFYRLVTQRSP
jgi:hypothetical protein